MAAERRAYSFFRLKVPRRGFLSDLSKSLRFGLVFVTPSDFAFFERVKLR